MALNSITKRWARGNLLFTVLVVLFAEALFIFFVFSSYYQSSRLAMQNKLDALESQLSFYAADSTQNKQFKMRDAVENFDAKEQFELMMIDKNGNVVLTSSGEIPDFEKLPSDIADLINSDQATHGEYVGKNDNSERVMAITVKAPYVTDTVWAMRLVTSVEYMDSVIWGTVLVSFAVVCVVILATVLSGTYFIRSIVMPLQKIENTASLIAKGDFETRIDNKNQDEIGRLSETINHMAEELSKNDRLKNEFISSVSHELRTPLTSIKGWSETIKDIKDPEDVNFQRGMEIISGETDRLYDMVEELLDFSRMQSSGIVLEKELLDMAAEVEDALLIVGQRVKNLNIQINYEAPENPMPVMGERNRIRQVFLNIIDNAIKYSYSGGNIWVDVYPEGEEIKVSVKDEGVGVSKNDIEKIHIKFYKGKGATRGSGIGLAVVDEIMKAHSGRLEVKSKEGKGTCVYLCFPLYKPQRAH